MSEQDSSSAGTEARLDVRGFVTRLSPEPVCDACVAGRLGAAAEAVALHIAELAGTAGFERAKSICSLCGEEKSVIRRT